VSVLVAGIGNIFLGDDGFGVEVVQRLAERPLPEDVTVADFGIRGFDLANALLDADGPVVLVDALPRGAAPGTLYVLEPSPVTDAEPSIEPHGMDPMSVLRLVQSLGGRVPKVLVVGCEPTTVLCEDDEMQIGLSPAVEAAVGEAVTMIEQLVGKLERSAV